MSLLEIIKKNQEMRSLFGKQELFIIEKQLLGVQLKPSEKTRLSRDIRKKFNAIGSLIPYKKDFDLKHGIEVKEIIEDTLEMIKDTKYLSNIKRIILFGSTSQKSRTVLSDIDIAVEFDNVEKKEAAKFRMSLLGKVNKKVDVQIYNFLPKKIKNQIDKYGKKIFKRD